MRLQVMDFERCMSAGKRRLGWKVGFGAPAALAKFGLDAPLVGFLLADNQLPNGANCRLTGWHKPVAEPEIAVYMGKDLAGGCSQAQAQDAIGAIGPAIELADMSFPPEEISEILAGNIYQRHVILGPRDETRAGARLEGLEGHLVVNGVGQTHVVDLEANTGRIIGIVRHVANTLAELGLKLCTGDVIIAGSVTPPLFLDASHRELAFDLAPIGSVAVSLSG